MKRISSFICAILIVLISYTIGSGMVTVLYDDFDDGSLHQDWIITYENGAIGWTYTEVGTDLSVTDIETDLVIQEPSGVPWPTASLSRNFTPLDDFLIIFRISWDSYDDAGLQRVQAMQFLKISLYDENDNFIGIEGGCVDGWVGDKGAKYAMVNDAWYRPPRSLNYNGLATIKIRRNNGIVEILWNSEILVSSTNTTPLGRVDLVFGYNPYDGNRDGIPEAYFGKESVDLISISGEPFNHAPIADCGQERVVVFDEIALDGSASYDPDGTIMSYEWSLQHENGSIITASGPNPTITDLPPGFYDVYLTVTDDGGLVGIDNLLLAAAGSCICTGTTMHIQSITASVKTEAKNWKYGRVTVTILDDCGNTVPNAEISGTFTGDFNETVTGTTDIDGTAVITTSTYLKKPLYMFCVNSVSHGTLTYEPNDNVEDCESH